MCGWEALTFRYLFFGKKYPPKNTSIFPEKFYIMRVTYIFSTALIFQLSAATVLQIYRTKTRQGYSGWQNGADYFTIPSSLCGGKKYECSVFNADGVAKSCDCSCPMKKSTFTPFENQWSCMENSNVRTNLQSDNTNPNEKSKLEIL